MGKSSEVNLQADCLVKALVQDSERPANEGGLPKGGSPLRMCGESCGSLGTRLVLLQCGQTTCWVIFVLT